MVAPTLSLLNFLENQGLGGPYKIAEAKANFTFAPPVCPNTDNSIFDPLLESS